MKTKYVMAGCKSTQHGRFKTREDLEALLLTLSDIVLEVGSDQKRSPRILDDGTIDTNDTTLRQYHNFLEAEAIRKKDAEDNVSGHMMTSNKKRKSSAECTVDEDEYEDDDEEADTEDDVESLATLLSTSNAEVFRDAE
jgi:hypothetical protein